MIYPDKKFVWLKPDELTMLPGRRIADEIDYEIVALTESICEIGIVEPLVVRKISLKGYELISGYRRLAAAKRLALRRIPCVVCIADDKTAAFISVSENLRRKSDSFITQAQNISRLMKTYNVSEEEAAVKLGIACSALRRMLSVLKLDPVSLERIKSEGLSKYHAEALLSLPEELRAKALDMMISSNDLNLAAQKIADEVLEEARSGVVFKKESEETKEPAGEEKTNPAPVRKVQIGDMRLFSNSLLRLVDTMQNAGISAASKRFETDKYVEYRIRIPKQKDSREYTQLSLAETI